MNITVYLGANEGREPGLKTAVRELGAWIGEHGIHWSTAAHGSV